nr:response regulator [Oceanococcus sp. HetDA_MAG_MS8]
MSDAATVLVADDEDNILVSLEFLLARAGFSVLVARDGEAALEMAQQHHPDLLLLDVMMPKLDGFSVCQALRALPEFAHTPIVMLTAKGRDADRVKGRALGATDYVIKPFSTRELLTRVQGLLDQAKEP